MQRTASGPRRKLLVPEVIQTSMMDCGPASLQCLLEGFGIQVSYDRLREACQTDVDGTSIDTLEDVAADLGLRAQQTMLPADWLFLPEARACPAIVVVRLPNGNTHFVVLWRRHGPFLQIMDPACGRRWVRATRFLQELYIHSLAVAAADWREWAGSAELVSCLRQGLARLGMAAQPASEHIERALADPGWRGLATLDAAIRLVRSLVESGGVRAGAEAGRLLARLVTGTDDAPPGADIPESWWSVVAAPATSGAEQIMLRGAVMVRILGARRQASPAPSSAEPPGGEGVAAPDPARSPQLAAALQAPPTRVGRELLRLLRQDGLLRPAVVACALLLSAAGVVLEALIFRSFLGIGQHLGLPGQRLGALGVLVLLATAVLLLELPASAALLGMGRRLEARFRVAFLHKLPRMEERYFATRLPSDMADRCHQIHMVRMLPELGGQLVRAAVELVVLALGLIWLDPAIWPLALCAAAVGLLLPLATQPVLVERDLRFRTHGATLAR